MHRRIIFTTFARYFNYNSMTKYKEIVYMCLDILKLVSDDSHFNEEHILFLVDKYRSAVIKQQYTDVKKEIPESNYQTVCVDLEPYNLLEGDCSGEVYLRSIQEIPNMLQIGSRKISSLDYFKGDFAYVNNERFKYVGNNKYLNNQIYGTIIPDNHLYLRSNNPQFQYIEKVRITGIFEDARKAAELQCPDSKGDKPCDVMDTDFPLEEALIPIVIEYVIKDIGGQKYQAEDKVNNANDDLSDLAAYIRQQMANGRRSDLYKGYS